jgi:hypothetical protein
LLSLPPTAPAAWWDEVETYHQSEHVDYLPAPYHYGPNAVREAEAASPETAVKEMARARLEGRL